MEQEGQSGEGFGEESKEGETQEDLVFSYQHFCQNDSKFQGLKGLFPEYRGFCWYACLVMAADAVQPQKDQSQVMRDLNSMLFRTDRKETMKTFEEMRLDGKDTSVFFKEGVLDFLDPETAGLERSFHVRHPQEFSDFVNQLFKKNSINLELGIENVLIVPSSLQDSIPRLRKIIAQGKVPILPNVVCNQDRKIIAGHFVIVSGVTSDQIIISDPNEPEPAKISHSDFTKYLEEGIIVGGNKRMFYDEKAGIFTLQKADSSVS